MVKEKWIISVGGGYGEFEFFGTEEEAEEMRVHKARWEGAVATKRRLTRRAADLAIVCERCGYMATYPICTKCGNPIPRPPNR